MAKGGGLYSGPVRVQRDVWDAAKRVCGTQPDGDVLIEALGLAGEWDASLVGLEDEDELEPEEEPA